MGTMRCVKVLFIFFFVISCNEYINYDDSFGSILIKDWNFSRCPKEITFEIYEKNSNLKKVIDTIFDIDIYNDNCHPKYNKFNKIIKTSTYNKQILLSSYTRYKGQINYDMRLIIDDSIEYKITDIKTKIDTTFKAFSIGRKYYINNSIYSMKVNNQKVENESADIVLLAKLGKIIKK